MTRIIINGSKGRMGQALVACAQKYRGLELVAQVDQGDSLDAVVGKGDVVLDFSSHAVTVEVATLCARHGKALVIGTTGFSQGETAVIRGYAERIPVVLSPNMSQGVNILFHLVKQAAELLGEEFDIEIQEIHHNQKKDAPSGTALQFGRIIAEAKKKDLADIAVYGRQGMIGERKKGEIGIMAMRVADVVGEHTIVFGGPGERIEFTHKASSRKTFASGALRAVKYIQGKNKGLYTMKDVLGLS